MKARLKSWPQDKYPPTLKLFIVILYGDSSDFCRTYEIVRLKPYFQKQKTDQLILRIGFN